MEDVMIYQRYFQSDNYGDDRMAYPEHQPRRRFFLEMGAYDGLAETNTRFFEACLGWTGLLIEASPPSFAKLEANGPVLRPNSDLLNVAPSCPDFSFVDMPFFSNTGVSLHEGVGGLSDDKIHRVQCGPLSYYLEQLGIRKLDFWALDVEAYEWHVLRTFDFAKVDVEVRTYPGRKISS